MPARSVALALTVPPLVHARARPGDYTGAAGAAALAERIQAAWRACGQPAPEVEIAVLRTVAREERQPALHCPRVLAPGGVPAGYTGAVRVL